MLIDLINGIANWGTTISLSGAEGKWLIDFVYIEFLYQ